MKLSRNLLLIALTLSLFIAPQSYANIDGATAKKIAIAYAGKPFMDFKNFAVELYFSGRGYFSQEDHEAIGEFAASEELTAPQRELMFRLLGVYAQLKYGGDAIRSLAELVAIPTYRQDGIEQHENENFKKLEAAIRQLAQESGLKYRNVDDRVYEISYGSEGKTLIGLHAHGDVVPANAESWVLEDGTKLDPFKMTRVGDRLYGRGTQDDKNGIVAVIYAMRVLKEENISLFNEFKLLVDTTEETSSTAIPYYFERNPTPEYNFALDGDYPVVIAEKGFGVVKTSFPVRPGGEGDVEFVSVTGGLAYNQIPTVSVAKVRARRSKFWAGELSRLGAEFVADNGGDFDISVQQSRGGLTVTVKGESAHSSSPESGTNPVSRMFLFINKVNQRSRVKQNHITDAAKYVHDLWGIGFYGRQFRIAFEDDFMGPMTAALTKVALSESELEIAVNLRIPVGKETSVIEAEVLERIESWQDSSDVDLTLAITTKEPMYRDPQGPWVNALLDVASQNLDLPREFGSSAGGTSVHFLPNGVQFGLSMPDEKYTGHNANEFKSLDQFLLDLQIVTEMIIRVGQMEDLR